MKMSTKGRYGLEALVDLAIYGGQEYITLKSIAERQGISEKYLEQIFISLRREGLIESLRGAQGGYRLARDGAEISVKEVLHALEGPLALVDCITKAEEGRCDHFECCVTRILWQKVMRELDEVAEAISLAEIARLFKETEAGTGEYYI